MSVADLLAEHGSPLWLANLDVVRDRQRSFTAAWCAEWPDVEIAYSQKANRLPAILRTLAEKGTGHQVACEAEYCLARSVADADGRSIVVQGPAKPPALLDRAAADGALVVVDTLAELRRLAAAGVTRVGVRVCLPGVGHGTSHFGVPMAEVSMAPRHAAALGLRIEALAVHLVSAGFDRPMAEIQRLASALVVKWPQPPERFAAAAKMLAGLAVRMGVPGHRRRRGLPARSRRGRLRARRHRRDRRGRLRGSRAGRARARARGRRRGPGRHGHRGQAPARSPPLHRPGRGSQPAARNALRVADHRGARHPRPGRRAALVTGPLCSNVDVLHPAADLPALAEGDAVVIRGVGAYQQTQSTQFGDLRPAVVARDDGHWRLVSRRETVEDLIATDLGVDVPQTTT